jgi:hypothetical protein
MLFALPALSLSYFCRYTVIPPAPGHAEHFDLSVTDGDLICVNASSAYLTVIFQPTDFLKIRAFSSTADDPSLSSVGRLTIPSEFAGVAFGAAHGHVEIRALLAGRAVFSILTYPATCASYRYLTTMRNDRIQIASAFGLTALGNPASPKLCLWSPHDRTQFSIPAEEAIRDAVELCSSTTNCTVPLLRKREGEVPVDATGSAFLQLDAENPKFAGAFSIGVRALKSGGFFNGRHLFNEKSRFELIPIARRPEPRTAVLDPGDEPAHVHAKHKEASKTAHGIQMAGIFGLGGLAVLVIAQYVLRRPLRFARRGDESEERLLLEGDLERFAPFPRLYPGYYQPPEDSHAPYPSVVFPSAEPVPGQ